MLKVRKFLDEIWETITLKKYYSLSHLLIHSFQQRKIKPKVSSFIKTKQKKLTKNWIYARTDQQNFSSLTRFCTNEKKN